MRLIILTLTCVLYITAVKGQVTETTNSNTEQQLENITENSEDAETEDDSYLQQLSQFLKNPVNLNTADEYTLKELFMLSPLQIQNLISYRNLFGTFINRYELQAVPGWNVRTIQKLLPYVTVSNPTDLIDAIGDRLQNGNHTILFRVSQVMEQSRGYKLDPSTVRNVYPGSPQRLFFRYRYTYKNLLQYGIVGEKDAGEEFFKGSQKQGFDFYSAHLFARNIGIIKSLAIGDFTVNMGQGLIQWQSLAFKKGPDISAIKRQAAVLRPYNSAGEFNFHRGVGVTIGKRNWEATVFGSYRNIDANFQASDSVLVDDDFVTSFQTSGLHRTASEVEDKAIQRQIAFGGNMSYRFNRLKLGLNAIQFNMKYPLVRASDPYNLFALSGKSFGNYSLDYSYTYKNIHVFGEAAMTNKQHPAIVSGMMLSVSNNVDMSLFYRNISRGYQSLYTNAFTESTFPTNEKGFYTGISIRPTSQWQIDAYADIYRFPWLRFRVNAPSTGSDYFVQLSYKPSRQIDFYTRYKRESKAINFNPESMPQNPVINQPRQNWRTQVSYKISRQFTLRNRIDMMWFDKKGGAASQGFLIFGDVLYKPMMKPISANMRLQFFQTDDYNSRLYAFENDVLYSFSIPVFYEKGYRYYININYDVSKKLTFWARWSQTIYPDRTTIGSGLDLINGNRRSETRIQAMYSF